MRIIAVIALLTMLSISGWAQKDCFTKKKAPKKVENDFIEINKLIGSQQYERALTELEKLIAKEPNFIDANIMLGELYGLMRQPEKAKERFEAALSCGEDYGLHRIYLSLAEQERELGNYADGKEYAEKLLAINDLTYSYKLKGERLLELCDFADKAIKNPVPFDPKNLGPEVNSSFEEYLPAVTADEQTLLFTRKLGVQGAYNEDFFISQKVDGKWGQAKNLGVPINSRLNEGAHTISPDGKYLFFTACNRPDGMGRCDIYLSYKVGNKWAEPINMGPPVNSPAWESQPTISADGQFLYFCSNRKGGQGRIDIWVSQLGTDGRWREPVNLGPKINTRLDEQSPFIHPDGKTLYFSSKGHIGMGNEDIYYTRLDSTGEWGDPVNLGYPINTTNNENSLFVSTDGKTAYFSSDRYGGSGTLDLHSFELYEEARPNPVTYVKGVITDSKTKKMLQAKVELLDRQTGEAVVTSLSDEVTGEFLVCIPAGKNYALNVNKEKYLFHSENFSLKNRNPEKPYLMDIALDPIMANEVIILNNVFFETNSYELLDESKAELDRAVKLLADNPSFHVEVGGHTDSIGKAEDNLILSEKRAKSVMEYLTQNAIPKERLTYRGYGESKPIVSNQTPEGRARNRRTEFRIMGN